MGMKKEYDGYEAYDYLEENVDYKKFEMPDEMNFGEPYEVPLSEDEEKKVEEILKENVYVSLHEHPRCVPKNMEEIMDYKSEGRECVPYKWLAKCYYDAIFDNLMDGTAMITSKNGWKWRDIIYDLGQRMCDVAHQDMIVQSKSVEDIKRAHEENKIALIPTLEASTMIENEVDRIDILYGLGVRMMGIVYSQSNSLGTGLKEKRDGGLTYFGEEAVERMNKLGMAIDVSHASDQTCLDTFEASKDPVFITHAGARELWESNRLKPDNVLKACAETGGLIGIEAAPHTTITENNPKHSIESFMEHFEYTVDLVGIDHVTFGPDTSFGDHVGIHHAFADALSTDSSDQEEKSAPEVEYVKGLENPTEASHNIIRWLVKHGYSDEEIRKVMGGNTLRVLEDIW